MEPIRDFWEGTSVDPETETSASVNQDDIADEQRSNQLSGLYRF